MADGTIYDPKITPDIRPGWHQTPRIGEARKCLVCALDKPWGIWDGDTGVAVCADCRDKARRPAVTGVVGPGDTLPVLFWLAVQKYPGQPYLVNVHDGSQTMDFMGHGTGEDMIEAILAATYAGIARLQELAATPPENPPASKPPVAE